MPNENESLETLIVSLVKMTGKTNEKVDELMKRVHQLEVAYKEQQINRVYSFIAEPPNPASGFRRKEYSRK